jgi:signal transduction histidine kinase
MRIFNRLYLKVYVTVVGTLVMAFLVSAALWASGPEQAMARNAFGMASGVASAALGDPAAPMADQLKALARLSQLLEADLAVYDAKGRLIGTAGAPLPTPDEIDSDRPRSWSRNPVWKFQLQDRRVIVIRPPFQRRVHGSGFLMHMAIVALILAIGSFPIVRGLTRRLERLQHGVETLGAGNLSVRVKVEGRDEVAKVAESFNRAAGRIEELIGAHRMLLANASHELRTPLTRLRLGVDRLKGSADDSVKADVERDIAELDALIEEILLTSRLEALRGLDTVEDVDLLALAAEEGARYEDIGVSGEPLTVKGDPRLLRRIIRNLIENALRHGKPPVDVTVLGTGESVILRVTDHGNGVPEQDRDRIFEPFFRKSVQTSSDSGTGLGLALVRQIARLHAGDVRLEAESTFAVTLPKCGI